MIFYIDPQIASVDTANKITQTVRLMVKYETHTFNMTLETLCRNGGKEVALDYFSNKDIDVSPDMCNWIMNTINSYNFAIDYEQFDHFLKCVIENKRQF